MNQFTERYKTLSTLALLKIIDNPNDYQPFAIDAAKEELTARHISAEELALANAENDAELQEKQLKTERRNAFENKVRNIGSSIVETIHPIQQTPPSANKIITILSIVFGVLFLIEFFNEFSFIKFMLTDRAAKWGFEMVFYLLSIFFIPVAAYLFWKRKKLGWILFCAFFTYSGLSAVILFFMLLKHRTIDPAIDNLFPAASPIAPLWNTLFFSGCLWFIFKNNIREIYNIDKQTMIIATGSGVILTTLIVFISMAR
jgi:hypothetical protein